MRGKGILLFVVLLPGLVAVARMAWWRPSVVTSGGSPPAAADASFSFPDDSGGKLLADLLPPQDIMPPPSSELPAGPLVFPTPPGLSDLELPWPAERAALPLGPPPPSHPIRPAAPPEELPVPDRWNDLPPQRPEPPAGPRLRVASIAEEEALSLPLLSPRPAEVGWADKLTSEGSASLPMALPQRKPIPFARLHSADRLQPRRAARLLPEPAEDPMPVSGAPRLPGR